MSSKILALLGLSDSGSAADESHRKRRTDYMKKFQRLVVSEEEGEEDEGAPENIVTAPSEEQSDAEQDARYAQEDGTSSQGRQTQGRRGDETPEAEAREHEEPVADRRGESGAKHEKKHFFSFGESLHRPKEDHRLILVKNGASEMIDDIEEALFQGQNVLLDFGHEDRETAMRTITKLANYVRTHNGSFYTVTATSMLLSMGRDAVVEWRPDESE